MTENLTPIPGRAFFGDVGGMGTKLVTVRSVRKRKDGTASKVTLIYETDEVQAVVTLNMPKDGLMHGFRRVSVALYGTARRMSDLTGSKVPTDAFVLVTRDRIHDLDNPLKT